MSAMRETDQADWDLERCFEMFDEALISRDERVVNALRNLLMIVTLTAPETNLSGIDQRTGPLRRIMEDQRNLSRRMAAMEDELGSIRNSMMPRNYIKDAATELDLTHMKTWAVGGGGYGGGGYPQGGGYGGGPGITTPIAAGHFTSAQEELIQNTIRGLLDDE